MNHDRHWLFLGSALVLGGILLVPGLAFPQADPGAGNGRGAQVFNALVAASRHMPPALSGDGNRSGNKRGISPPDGLSALRSDALNRPILFEVNRGQAHPDVAFVSRMGGTNVFFTPGEIVLSVGRPVDRERTDTATPETTVFRFRFEGADPETRIEARDRAPTVSNYLTGRSPDGWHTNIPVFREIVYRSLYPGIDLRLHGSEGRLEYDFVVSPGADPERIRVAALGGDASGLDFEGNHLISAKDGASVKQLRPFAYQGSDDERLVVAARFEPLGNHRFGFRVDDYDEGKSLVIDPVLDFSTYIGGAQFDRARAIAVDPLGNIHIAGQTQSTDFPLENPMDAQAGGSFDIFALKFTPDGSSLVYSTYIAGGQLDIAYGIAADAAGSAYLTGETASDDFPTTSVIGNPGSGAFILKLSPDGSGVSYSTRFGGQSLEKGYDVAVDDFGNAYVAGLTASTDFPVKNAFQSQRGGGFDAFVGKFGPTGSLLYLTYLGGDGEDNLGASSSGGIGIAVDDEGNAYVTGDTKSTDFPTKNAFRATRSGAQDAFVAKFGPTGSLLYSTYLGGSDGGTSLGEEGFDIGVDATGNAYVVGSTRSADFPTHDALQGALGGSQDFFVAALDPEGAGLVYSTYLGGSLADASVAGGIAVDRCGNAFVTGTTNSSDFALENLAGTGISGTRVFLAKIEAGGANLLYSANIGNGSSARIALGPSGSAYLTGHTISASFPAVDAYQPTRAGDADAFVARVSHVRPVGDLPGEYRVCSDEPVQINVARNLAADPGREWFAFLLVSGGIPSPIYFLTDTGAEAYVEGTALNSYTPFSYTGNTLIPELTLDALGMTSGDQVIYAYLYEKDGVLNLDHIVFVTAR